MYLETDLLIIGGGSAGCMAAIRAQELDPEIKVVFFEKGDIKYSGSIARGMDALNIVAIPNLTTPELYMEAITQGCDGVADEPASYTMAARSFDLLKKLERWGVYFPQDQSGNYRTLKYHVKGHFQTAMQEPDLKVMLSQRALEGDTLVCNRVMGIHLLTDDGRVCGAIGLNVRTGELVVCRAKAVILSAGGQARFSLPNSGYMYGTFDFPGNSGDGFCMAYHAGARLTGMECGIAPLLIKDANMPLLAITVTRGGRVMDIFDNILMEGEVSNMDNMDWADENGFGPLRIKLNHLDEAIISEIEGILFTTERPAQERFFKSRGVDFRKRDIELWRVETQLCGGHGMSGVIVNEKAETGIPGLYAAGDVASVPKQHLSGALVFGEVAAEQAVAFVSGNPTVTVNRTQVDEVERDRNRRFTTVDRDIESSQMEYKVRRFIGDYLVGWKNRYKLDRWLEMADVFRNELRSKALARNPHELSKLYEIENIIRCADFSARASLERKESRWGFSHRRSDYPERNDKDFSCHVTINRGESAEDIRVGQAPIIRMNQEEDVQ